MEINNRKYRPDMETVAHNKIYYEVWNGLPDLSFQEVQTDSGQPGLRYRQDGNYVWISPDTVEVINHKPDAVLLAVLRHLPGKVHAFWVSPAMKTVFEGPQTQHESIPRRSERVSMSLREAIEHAEKLNRGR